MILGGVGLGVCSACRAPGAFYYQPEAFAGHWPGVWMCDSCCLPETARYRIQRDLARVRSTT